MAHRPCRPLVAASLLVVLGSAALPAQAPLGFRDLAAGIVKGAKGVQGMRGRIVAGFQAGECRVDTGGLVASIECANQRALDEAPATRVLEELLNRARADLKPPEWKESKWTAAKAGASFKHASGAEIDIGIPQDLGAGLPSAYGPVLVIGLAADEPR